MIVLTSRFESEFARLIVKEPATSTDLSGQRRRLAGRLKPRNLSDVGRIVRSAGRNRIKLHPISCGKNWGFGSALPPKNDVWLIDLGCLDRIHSYDAETGSICIEPGVTQLKLYRELERHGSEWFFNVTGAGHVTSVLGNALERGVGYQGQRHLDIIDLQIVTGSGDTINSRLATDFDRNGVASLGPDLSGLFVQSSFGIVVSARIRLIKRTTGGGAAIVRLKDSSRSEDFFSSILDLKRDGCISGVPHIANKSRIVVTMAPWLSSAKVTAFAADAALWTAALPITGCREMTQTAFSVMRRRMRDFCEVRTILAGRSTDGPFSVSSPEEQLQQLVSGYPSNLALPGVHWAARGQADILNLDPESTCSGLIHVTPALPSSGKAIAKALKAVDRAARQLDLGDLPVTVNVVDNRLTVLVISIGFEMAAAKVAKAKARKLERCFQKEGLWPYRIGLGQEQWLPSPSSQATDLFKKLRGTFDPNAVFAASKYDRMFGTDETLRTLGRLPYMETLLEVA